MYCNSRRKLANTLYKAEAWRLQGELLLLESVSNIDKAIDCFQKSITLVWQQQSRLLELRATLGFARTLHKQRKPKHDPDQLSTLVNWFTEVQDKVNLRNAALLHGELG